MDNNFSNNNSNYGSQHNNFQNSNFNSNNLMSNQKNDLNNNLNNDQFTNFQTVNPNNQVNNEQNGFNNNFNNNQFINFQNVNPNNQTETNVNQLNNYSNTTNKENKKANYTPIIIVVGIVVAIFLASSLLGKNNGSNIGSMNSDTQGTDNNKEESTPNGSTIELGETIKIREKNTNIDLKIESFEPSVKITSESGITNTYAVLTGIATNNSKENDDSLRNINIYDANNNRIAPCSPKTSKDSQNKSLGKIGPNETKKVYYLCFLSSSVKNKTAIKGVYTHTEYAYEYINGKLQETEKELEYYINLN